MKMYRLNVLILFLLVCCSCAGTEKKEVKASEIISLVKKGKPVHIVNKIIIGDVDFTGSSKPFILNANMLQCTIQPNIFFEQCVFMGKVTSNGRLEKTAIQSCFKSNLVFTGCDFRGEVDFSGAVVFGMVNFGRSVFRKEVNFNHIAVWAKDSYFSEMNAENTFSMVNASFAGNLNFISAAFHSSASFQETSVKGKLMFNNASFDEGAGFDMMLVYDNAFFSWAKFAKTADFSSSRFMGAVEMSNATFERPANFEKASFMNGKNE